MQKKIAKNIAIIVFFIILSTFLSGCIPEFNKVPTAGLQINTGNIRSSVFINGQYLDKSPLIKKDLKPAEYYIEIKPDDEELATYQTNLTLLPSLLTVITWVPGKTPEQSGGVIYEMEPLSDKDKSEVSFSSIPDGAIVEFADFDKDFTPVVFTNVEPEEKEFTVSLPSYSTQKHSIRVVKGYKMHITVKMAKLSAYTKIPNSNETPSSTNNLSNYSNDNIATSSGFVTITPTNLYINGTEVLRVRNGPGLDTDSIGTVKVGEKYQLLNRPNNGWIEIQVGTASGWVSEAYTTPD